MPSPAPSRKSRSASPRRDKLERTLPSHGKIVALPARLQPRFGGAATLLIPRPIDVDAEMRSVRKGRLITPAQIRVRLARAAGAQAACPLTTGIFMRIAAEAAEEDRRAGKRRITPWWRTIKDDGSLIDTFPGGATAHAAALLKEGIAIDAPSGRRTRPRVKDFEKRLVR